MPYLSLKNNVNVKNNVKNNTNTGSKQSLVWWFSPKGTG